MEVSQFSVGPTFESPLARRARWPRCGQGGTGPAEVAGAEIDSIDPLVIGQDIGRAPFHDAAYSLLSGSIQKNCRIG